MCVPTAHLGARRITALSVRNGWLITRHRGIYALIVHSEVRKIIVLCVASELRVIEFIRFRFRYIYR